MANTEILKKPVGEIGLVLHKGGYYDIKTGKIVGGEILKEEKIKNLIVNKASELMACRMAPGQFSGIAPNCDIGNFLQSGLQYLAVGVGICQNPSKIYSPASNDVDPLKWSMQNPTAASVEVTQLQGELFRKQFTSWCFVDSMGNDIVDPNQTSNILKLVVTFDDGEAVGPITEMGLFGGNAQPWNGGNGRGTGFMFNYKTFPVWNKTSDAKLTITWRLTF